MTDQRSVPRTGRRRVEALLDALLLALYLLLVAPRLTGLPAHEWLGIALVPAIVAHLLLSWRWIAVSTRRLARERSARARVNYVLNALLFVLLTLVVASGVAISEVAVPAFGVPTIDDRAWRSLHNLTLNWLLLLVGFHIAVNWDWVRRTLRSMRSRTAWSTRLRLPSVTRLSGRVLAILTAAGAITVAAFVSLGAPSATRRYAMNEFARFERSSWHGWVQLFAEASLVFAAVYLGRRGLRLRL